MIEEGFLLLGGGVSIAENYPFAGEFFRNVPVLPCLSYLRI